jgi:cold shock CspA family protein
MSRGRVQWYSEALGYGFIETSKGTRVLVRPSGVDRPEEEHPLQEGAEVEFAIRSRDDGVVEARGVFTPTDA